MKTSKGFTLIELLVVIAIIGLLASIVLVALNTARSKSRDAQRLSSFQNMKQALELYYNDNRSYPDPTLACGTTDVWSSWSCWSTIIPTTYLTKTPSDPQNVDLGSCNTTLNCHVYHYCRLSSGQSYVLAVNLENAPLVTLGSPAGCATAGPNQYWVSS